MLGRKTSRSLLLLFDDLLDNGDNFLDDGLLDGDGESLAIGTSLPHGVSGESTDVSVLMVSHEPALTLGGLLLELDNLTGSINLEVLEGGLGSLLVDVLDLLWLGVNLLLSLSLTTIKVVVDNDVGLGGDALLVEGGGVVEDGGTVHEVIALVASKLFNLVSKQKENLQVNGTAREKVMHSRCVLRCD